MTVQIKYKPTADTKVLTVINMQRLDDADMIRIDGTYQTEIRWTLYQKQLFIDSLLRWFDIPKLYFHVRFENSIERYYVVDGQQRLHATKQFLDNEFPLLPDADPIEGTEIAGKRCEELCPNFIVQHLDNRNFDVVYLRNYTNDMIKDLFLRLNSMSALNAAEKRNAIPGNMPGIVRRIALHKIFKDNQFVAITKKRAGHQNVVAGILHQIIHGDIVDIRPTSLANTYKSYELVTNDHWSVKKINRTFNFLIKAFNKRSKKLKKFSLMRLSFIVAQMLDEYDLSKYPGQFGKAYIEFELDRIRNNELPEIEQNPELVAYNDAARGDKVSDMTYIHNMLKRNIAKSMPYLNLKDRQRNFTQEQRFVIFENCGKKCQTCNKSIRFENFHADHIESWARGGETSIENGQALCSDCNFKKSDNLTPDDNGSTDQQVFQDIELPC